MRRMGSRRIRKRVALGNAMILCNSSMERKEGQIEVARRSYCASNSVFCLCQAVDSWPVGGINRPSIWTSWRGCGRRGVGVACSGGGEGNDERGGTDKQRQADGSRQRVPRSTRPKNRGNPVIPLVCPFCKALPVVFLSSLSLSYLFIFHPH